MNGKILLVDDDRELCELTGKRLEKQGVIIETAFDGEAALTALTAGRYDAVVTDVHMPGLDGIELTRHVSELWPNTKVVILTSLSNVETAIAAIRAGAYDFVTKPLDMDILALALERAVRAHFSISFLSVTSR